MKKAIKEDRFEAKIYHHYRPNSIGPDYRAAKYGNSHLSLFFLDYQHVPYPCDNRFSFYRISFGSVGWLSISKAMILENSL